MYFFPDFEDEEYAEDLSYMYDYILDEMAVQLSDYGFKRSGKGLLFYQYYENKKIVCGIKMQKSMDNCRGYHKFTFNIMCSSLRWEKDVVKQITLKHLQNYDYGVLYDRIGCVVGPGDKWYLITSNILCGNDEKWFYDKYLRQDIAAAGKFMNDFVKEEIDFYYR